MRDGIIPHPYYLYHLNLNELMDYDFIFICMDGGSVKSKIIEKLVELNKPFIDIGIGLDVVDDKIIGLIKVVYSDIDNRNHIKDHIVVDEDDNDKIYSTNIQIVELNAWGATRAIIKWKQSVGFYEDLFKHNTFVFTLEVGREADKKK